MIMPAWVAPAPAAIRTLLRRCLERSPRLRLRDIGEARIAIDAYLKNPTPQSASVPAQQPASAQRPVIWMAATGIALLTAAGFAWLWLHPPRTEASPIRFGVDHLIESFSPDGRWMLAHIGTVLQVRLLRESAWRTLPGTEGVPLGGAYAFWSEDSNSVGFVSGDRLRTIALEGSTPKDLG